MSYVQLPYGEVIDKNKNYKGEHQKYIHKKAIAQVNISSFYCIYMMLKSQIFKPLSATSLTIRTISNLQLEILVKAYTKI